MAHDRPIYSIAGPTASGKTELGVELALRLGNAEIINCDSVQIYKEIEIATAKPSTAEMRGVVHHLIDYVDPRINYTAANWSDDASEKIREIESRGNTAILVGGTGFYLRSLRQPLFESPRTDMELRERLNLIREKKGPEHLHAMLSRVDPISASRQYPRDYPRVQRALEVYFQTGNKLSDLHKKPLDPPEFAKRIKVFVLNPPRKILYEIINRRSEKHFENGLIKETKRLRESGIPDDTNAMGSHGYRRACEFLREERSLESAVEKTCQDVRNYAKRQLSWFRREEGVIWLDGFGNDETVNTQLFTAISYL